MPTEKTFLSWKTRVPADFLFSVKANRHITHRKKLQDVSAYTDDFIKRASFLDKKLGPILFQLPPYWAADPDALTHFLSGLPKGHRYVFEFRHPSWYNESVFETLRYYQAAFCIYELAGHLSPLEATADFIYVRLHGPGGKYQGKYGDKALSEWADRCRQWQRESRDIFFYFDNDQHGFAAENARGLKALTASSQR